MEVNRNCTNWASGVNVPLESNYLFSSSAPAQSFQDYLRATATAKVENPTVEVKRGQSLTSIVRDQFKDLGVQPTNQQLNQAIGAIAQANAIANPNKIFPGQVLNLSAMTPPDSTSTLQTPSILERTAAAVSEPAQPVAMLNVAPATAAVPPQIEASASLATTTPQVLKQDIAPALAAAVSAPALPVAEEATPPQPVAETTPTLSALTAAAIAAAAPEETKPVAPIVPVEEEPDTEPATELVETTAPRVDLSQIVREILGEEPSTLASLPEPRNPWAAVLEGTGRITSGFGMRSDPFSGNREFHAGVDLAAKSGTPIHAYKAGVVEYSGWQDGYGRVVIVQHDDGTESVYGHNSANNVRKGQKVTEDTVLAEVGSTGRSTGSHLHFEIRKNGKAVDPVPYLAPEPVRYAQR